MSGSDKRPADWLDVVGMTLQKVQKFHERGVAAEAARRAKLLPAERAAEDHAKAQAVARAHSAQLHKRLVAMGPELLRRESWTIEKFAWLLAAENPDERGGLLDPENDLAADARQRFYRALESCVGTSLTPVNPTAPATEQRFAVTDLMRKAVEFQLGCFRELNVLQTQPSSSRTLASARGAALAAHPTARTDGQSSGPGALTNAQSPQSVTRAASSSAPLRAVAPAQTSAATSAAASATPSIPANPTGGRPLKPWHGALDDLLGAFERGARSCGEPFVAMALPENTKTLFGLLETLCTQRGIAPPPSPDGMYQQVYRRGFKFGGAGHKATSGTLGRWAAAAGLHL